MTAVPVAILIVFAIVIAGGPKELLSSLEGYLRAMVKWVADLTS